MKSFGLTLILTSLATFAQAGIVSAPEIDANMAASAVTLAAGAILVIRSRKK